MNDEMSINQSFLLTTTLNTAPMTRPKLWATKTTSILIKKNIQNLSHSMGCDDIGNMIIVNAAQHITAIGISIIVTDV